MESIKTEVRIPVVEKPRWVIRRGDAAAVIARKGFMPHATVYDTGATGSHIQDRWTPEAEKSARLLRSSEEMFDALKVIESKLEQIQRGTPNDDAVLQSALSECTRAMYAAETDYELISLHGYADLEQLYRDKKANMPVDRVNHREFVLTGWRYFCLYSSASQDMGWHVYKVEMEESIVDSKE
jgi:hypothetical protein